MKRKHLEWFLSELETFKNPKIHLEQYATNVQLAGILFPIIHNLDYSLWHFSVIYSQAGDMVEEDF